MGNTFIQTLPINKAFGQKMPFKRLKDLLRIFKVLRNEATKKPNLNKQFNKNKSYKSFRLEQESQNIFEFADGSIVHQQEQLIIKHTMWSGVEGPLTPNMFENKHHEIPPRVRLEHTLKYLEKWN